MNFESPVYVFLNGYGFIFPIKVRFVPVMRRGPDRGP